MWRDGQINAFPPHLYYLLEASMGIKLEILSEAAMYENVSRIAAGVAGASPSTPADMVAKYSLAIYFEIVRQSQELIKKTEQQ